MEALNIQLSSFFQWLLKTSLQGSLLIFLILLVQSVLRGRVPLRWHYYLWLLLLVRLAMPWVPQSRLSMFNLIPQYSWQERAEAALPTENTGDAEARTTADSETTEETAKRAVVEQKAVQPKPTTPESRLSSASAPAVPESAPYERSNSVSTVSVTAAKILPLAWFIGAMILGGYIAVRNFNLWRTIKRERPVTNQKILDLLEDCKMQMNVQTIVGVVVTDRIKSPALFGFVRPRLLLPQGLIEALDFEELRYVFLHELAHLKRRDIYLGWLISLLQIMHWFNPLIWLAFRRMRTDQELACDGLALSTMEADEPPKYGRTIVNLLERFSQVSYVPSIAGILEEPSQLERRIKMIAKFKNDSRQSSPLAVTLIIILACISLLDAKRTKASETSAAKPPSIVVRRVWADALSGLGTPSPDGRYLPFVDWDTGDLAVHDLTTGKNQRLTNKAIWNESNEFAGPSVFSPDGKQVAYIWRNKDNFYELRTVGLDGSEPRVLYRNRDAKPNKPYAWSSDGKHVLANLSKRDKTNQIALVSVPGGSARTIKSLGWRPANMDLSPDGRFIVYDDWTEIRVLATDGSGETTLIDHPAAERLLGWSPDGDWILFTSDRRGTWDAWAVQIRDGKPQGPAELVKLNIGQVSSVGFTRNGAFYYTTWSGHMSSVYTATVDMEAGTVLTKPVNLTQHRAGENTFAGWSPDGKWLAYFSRPYVKIPPRSTIVIRDVETGEEREIDPKKIRLNHLPGGCWSPDGRSLLLVGRDLQMRQSIYRLVVGSGEATPLVRARSRPMWPA